MFNFIVFGFQGIYANLVLPKYDEDFLAAFSAFIYLLTVNSPEIKLQETSNNLIVREVNQKLHKGLEAQKVLVLDMSQVHSVDYSAALGLSGVTKSH